MCAARKKLNSLSEVLKFTFPKLHTGSKWYVDFYAYDPATDTMRRKKFHLDNIGKITERRKRANEMIEGLTKLLRSGWSPWINAETNRSYTLLEDALEKYEAYVERMPKYKTRKAYTSRLNIFRKYNASRLLPIRYVYQFDRSFCVRFLDYVYVERGNSPTTRNNNLAFLREFSSFLVQHLYLKSKPTEGLKSIGKGAVSKNRTVIAPADMQRLHDWLDTHNRPFLLVCYFLHYMLIRPKEICRLRLQDINVAKQTVYIDGQISKNKKSGVVTLPTPILEMLVDLDYFNAPTSYYIFSTGFRPGPKLCSERSYRHYWNNEIVPALKFPKEYKFYSLKDSGITDMLRSGLDPLSVKEQARHSSLQITDAYTPRDVLNANPRLQSYKGIL